jgi:DNA-binding NarL/FixJ family response regulator
MKKIRIVIVEDLEEVAEGLSEFISLEKELQLVASYRTAEAATLEIPLLKPDIAIMDINLPGMSGIECIKQVKKSCPSTQFMMFTVYENNDQVFEALKAGASGYLLKKNFTCRNYCGNQGNASGRVTHEFDHCPEASFTFST